MWRPYVKCFKVFIDRVEDVVNDFLKSTYDLHSPENVQLVDVKVEPLSYSHDVHITIIYEVREGDRVLTRENERS